MSILERMFSGESSPVKGLHPDFRIKWGDSWYANKNYDSQVDGELKLKIRFSFDNPEQLNNIPFLGKIGINLDPELNGKFIGFAYGQDKDREALESWAKKFPYAEIIIGLDNNGVIKNDSQVIKLTS